MNLSIIKKLVLAYIFVVFIPVIVFSTYFLTLNLNYALNSHLENKQHLLEKSAKDISNKLIFNKNVISIVGISIDSK